MSLIINILSNKSITEVSVVDLFKKFLGIWNN